MDWNFPGSMSCWIVLRFQAKLYSSLGKYPIPLKQGEYCDRFSCLVNGSLITVGQLFKGWAMWPKATESSGLSNRAWACWTCWAAIWGPPFECLIVAGVCRNFCRPIMITVILRSLLEVVMFLEDSDLTFLLWIPLNICITMDLIDFPGRDDSFWLEIKWGTFSPSTSMCRGYQGSNTPILKVAAWLSKFGQSWHLWQ